MPLFASYLFFQKGIVCVILCFLLTLAFGWRCDYCCVFLGKVKKMLPPLKVERERRLFGTEPCRTAYIRNEYYFSLKSSSTAYESWAVEWKVTFLELTILSLFLGGGKDFKEKGLAECMYLWLEHARAKAYMHTEERAWRTSLQMPYQLIGCLFENIIPST